MAGSRSRNKGGRGEREAIAVIEERTGLKLVRSPNSGGLWLPGDLIGMDGYHLEVKYQETIRIWDYLKQAEEQAEGNNIPVVIFRRNRTPWYVCEKLVDWCDTGRWRKNGTE